MFWCILELRPFALVCAWFALPEPSSLTPPASRPLERRVVKLIGGFRKAVICRFVVGFAAGILADLPPTLRKLIASALRKNFTSLWGSRCHLRPLRR